MNAVIIAFYGDWFLLARIADDHEINSNRTKADEKIFV